MVMQSQRQGYGQGYVASSSAQSDERLARLLVVEDESIVAMDIAEQLGELGYEVCGIADNGNDAIRMVEQYRPDLVLMDVVIKGDMDGVETAQHLSRGFGCPVVFLTAYSDARTVSRAAEVAPYGYITKPFQAKELRAAVQVALYKSRLEAKLRESEQWFAATLRCVGDCVIATDPDGNIRFMNLAAERLLGWRLDDAIGRKIEEILPLHAADSGSPLESPAYRALRTDSVVGIEFGSHTLARDGRIIPIDDSAAPIRGDRGETLGIVVAFRDVTERVALEQSLRHSEGRFRSAFDFAPVGMALISLSGRFLQVNAALCKLLGYSEAQLLSFDQLALTHDADVASEAERLRMLTGDVMVSTQFEKRYRRENGSYIWCLVSVSVLANVDDSFCYLYQIHDLTERKESELKLARLAHYDTLTGLVNRARLWEEAELLLRIATRNGGRVAVIFMDLDHFKQINDSLGHEAGDELLKEVARRLKSSIRASDCVARFGGDEFVMLLPTIASAEDVAAVTSKIKKQFERSVRLGNRDVTVGISVGVSLFPEDGEDAKTLLRCADSALYHAKSLGRNNVQFYSSELTQRVEERLSLDAELRAAIERDEFELHYQPYISLSGDRQIGVEALIRWRHPDKGLVFPGAFIAYAEESGLIVPIGEWAMLTACCEAAKWPVVSGQAAGIAVNISARQFKATDMVQAVSAVLAKSGLPPGRLCLEITEQLLLEDTDNVIQTINKLKGMGVKIAIDDFGIGYSSLSYVKRFGPTKLKIDRSFINDLPQDADDAAIVKAVLAMAKSLGVEVVAEGVETQAQLEFLRREGCGFAQGYYISRPVPAAQFQNWLKTWGDPGQ